MEQFLVKQVLVMHLKPGDVIYNTITKEQVFDEIREIMRPDGMDDTTLLMKDGDELFCDEMDEFLVKLPSPDILIPSEEEIMTELDSEEQVSTTVFNKYANKTDARTAINWALSRLKELNPNINFKIK